MAGCPTVSVVIPTYNRGRLLINALESVLAQTYKDFEIIVIDDGSTDDTRERLKPYQERIRYVSQENKGVSASQNKGIELSRGKWVSILASDDLWDPCKLELQLATLQKYGGSSRGCFTDCEFFGDPAISGTAFEQACFSRAASDGILEDAARHILHRYPIIYVQSLLIERALIEEVGGFDNNMTVCEDTDLLFRLSFETKFCYVAEPVVKIDRTPQRAVGLSEIFLEESDRPYSSRDYMFRKWLTLPLRIEISTKNQILDHLKALQYEWLVSRLRGMRLLNVARNVKGLRHYGVSYAEISATLLTAGMRRCGLIGRNSKELASAPILRSPAKE